MRMVTRLLPPTVKVFCDEEPAQAGVPRIEGFQNERFSFQLACLLPCDPAGVRGHAELKVEADCLLPLRVRQVAEVPVHMGTPKDDGDYLRGGRPGLYPDVLEELPQRGLRATQGLWKCFWIDVEPDGAEAGEYSAALRVRDAVTGEVLGEETASVRVLPGNLPPQKLIHTRWMHTDCLSSWYGVPVFSEEYWRVTENYVRCAAEHGVNMLLTPIHTPPLDTRIGFERPTVQLVDVEIENGEYKFGFEKLDRWVEMALRCGMEYFEIAHLFSQWGAKYAVKIVAKVDGAEKRVFGWDTDAQSPEYVRFVDAYLAALLAELKRLGVDQRCYFHISDEPSGDNLPGYLAAKAVVEKRLEGYPIMDALSQVEFYKSGAVKKPIPAVNHIEPFLEEGVKGLWTYYCCGQYDRTPNVFIAMPGGRTRALAPLLYKFEIEGFLQWGFNFYYSIGSDFLVNPYLNTDWSGCVAAGDPFLVYPGRDGHPVESIRLMLVDEAMQDLRAMEMLETLAGREAVLALIDEGLQAPLLFTQLPRGGEYVLRLRQRINDEIVKRTV